MSWKIVVKSFGKFQKKVSMAMVFFVKLKPLSCPFTGRSAPKRIFCGKLPGTFSNQPLITVLVKFWEIVFFWKLPEICQNVPVKNVKIYFALPFPLKDS